MIPLRIETFRSLAALVAHRQEIDALNLAARRPCPFSTFEYLETWLAHDEYAAPSDRPLVLVAFEGARLIGYLPLCLRRERFFGLPFRRLGLLVTHDTDRPHAVARAEDERRCCEAFYRHLLERERGWSSLELVMQDQASGLNTLPPLRARSFYARRFETMPNSTLPLPRTLAEYFAALGSHQRKSEVRWCRALLEAGRVECVSATDPRARLPMLELYLDLERRSWKELAHAGIRRDPRRVGFFRALCAEGQPMQLGFDLVLLDDLPVCGLVTGAFAGGLHGLETAFDQDHEDLAPGHLSSLMVIRRAIEAGYASINYGGNYAYYKARMGAVVTETSAVQLYRVGSLPWLRARGGELRRWIFPPAAQAGQFNPERRKVTQGEGEADAQETKPAAAAASPAPAQKAPRKPAGPRPPREEERARTRAVLAALEAEGIPLGRLSGAALEHALPFSLRKAAA